MGKKKPHTLSDSADKLVGKYGIPWEESLASGGTMGELVMHVTTKAKETDRGRAQGGYKSGLRRKEENRERDEEIATAAAELLSTGRRPRELSSILARRFSLSTKTILKILRSEGVLLPP